MTTAKAWAILVENVDGEGTVAVPRVYIDKPHAERMIAEIAKTLAEDLGHVAIEQEGHDTPTWVTCTPGFEEEPGDDDYCRWLYVVETTLIEDKAE